MAAQVDFFVTMTPTAEVMAERIREVAAYKIPLALKRGIDTAMPDVIEDIKANRLSGKGPFPPAEHRLGVVTGLLSSSVSPLPSTMEVAGDTATVTGGLQVVGVPYANIHEFGFSGEENVSSHSRGTAKVIRTLRRQRQRKTEKQILTGSLPRARVIRGYTRQMNMPARAPFTYGMRDNLVRIRDSISTAIGQAFENT